MTDLVERLKWVSDAVSSQDLGVGALNGYLLRDNHIHATDGRMVVGTPFPFIGEALVPTAEFDRVLINRPDGDFSWEFESDRLVLKRGRFRGRIKLLPVDSWPYPTGLPDNVAPIPDGLVGGLAALLPFCSENATKPWATTIAIVEDYLYASNNVVIARCYLGTDEGETRQDRLIPRWVAEFVVKRQEGLTSWAMDDRSVTFVWSDGSWMRSSLIVDKFPDVLTVFRTFYDDQQIDVELHDDWRRALLRVGKITGDPVLRLRETGVYSASGEVLIVEDDASTPVPEGVTETVWDIRYLEPVIAVATHWNPRMYPKPAPWRNEFLEGVIAPRRD